LFTLPMKKKKKNEWRVKEVKSPQGSLNYDLRQRLFRHRGST